MTLTVVTGSSGSGKTTFLNDCHEQHKCIYIRQYHTARPYIPVTKIPKFDPTQLPYWDIYQREGKAETIKIGGTMAGEFIPGLSGGQRKLLLFELVRQRVMAPSEDSLLICLDEPFSGVTDDFVPFIVERLNEMRQKHNIVLVTNDHVDVLRDLADNTLTVSAIDRSNVHINNRPQPVDRVKALVALSVGDRYAYQTGSADLKFFFQVEVLANSALVGIACFVILIFGMVILTFWDSDKESASLVIIAGEILAYFSLNPYLLSAVDWRNYMKEEAEALMHASVATNLFLRTCLTLFLGFIIWNLEFLCVNLVVDGLLSVDVWYGIMMDNLSTTAPLIIMGLYTNAPQAEVEMVGSLPFLLMLFLSTAYSPGAGIPVLKELRYIFSKFYFWCYVPVVEDMMEGCPSTRAATLGYMACASLTFTVLYSVVGMIGSHKEKKRSSRRDKSAMELLDDEFCELQMELYGEAQGKEYFGKMLKKAELMRNGADSSHGSYRSKSSA